METASLNPDVLSAVLSRDVKRLTVTLATHSGSSLSWASVSLCMQKRVDSMSFDYVTLPCYTTWAAEVGIQQDSFLSQWLSSNDG